MVTAMPEFLPSSRDTTNSLKVRYYGALNYRAVFKTVHVQSNESGLSPRLELLMGGHRMQPYIHDGIISIKHKKKTTRFQIYVKNHKHLPCNRTFRRWRMVSWRGDIVVMKKGASRELVNILPADAKLADFAVKKFLSNVSQKLPFTIPKNLVFGRR